MDTRQVDQALAGLDARKTQRAQLPIRDKIRYLKQIQQPAPTPAQRWADATRHSHRETPIPEQPTANRGETAP
jgi:hypothetical protein